MNLIKAHKILVGQFKDEKAKLERIFFVKRDKRKCNSLLKGKFQHVTDKLIKHTGLPAFKLDNAQFHTLLTGESSQQCALPGCSCMTGYDVGKRKFKEFCSKQCANSSGVIRIRREQTMLDRYGVENAYQSKEIQQKIKDTNMKRFGVENPSSSQKIKQKRRKTFLRRYGVESPMESEELREKQKQSLQKAHGSDNPAKVDKFKAKAKETNIKRYGAANPMQNKQVAEKCKQNGIAACMEKYGVPNAMLNPEVLERWQSSFGRRQQMTICNREVFVQGYEKFAFEKLFDIKPFKAITTNIPKSKMVPYTYNGKQRMYVPDAAIKMLDGTVRVVEVKSWFTLSKELNIPKFKAATKFFNDLGIDFILVIVEPDTGYLRVIINPNKGLKSLCRTAKIFSSGRRTW